MLLANMIFIYRIGLYSTIVEVYINLYIKIYLVKK